MYRTWSATQVWWPHIPECMIITWVLLRFFNITWHEPIKRYQTSIKNSCIDPMFAQRYQTWYNTHPNTSPAHAHECMITQGGYHSPPLKPSLKAEVLSSKGLLSASFIHATFLFDFHPILAHWFAFTSRIRTKWNNQIAFLIECIILHIFGKGDDRITNHFIVPSWINLKSISFGHLINIQ